LIKKISDFIWRTIAWLYDRTCGSFAGVARQRSRARDSQGRTISVVIAHYNRGDRIHRPLANIIADPRVDEILIVDDASEPVQYEALCRNVKKLDHQGKVRIYRQEKNLGVVRNKLDAVRRAKGKWMILLDSDNTIFRNYLNQIFAMPSWDPKVKYCPSWAFPYFSFRRLVGERIDFNRAAELCRDLTLRRVYIINDGNYFFNRQEYLDQLSILENLQNDVADVMVANYLWLSRGNSLEVLGGAFYMHRIDASSFWMRTQVESRKRVMELFGRFERNERWDDSVLNGIE